MMPPNKNPEYPTGYIYTTALHRLLYVTVSSTFSIFLACQKGHATLRTPPLGVVITRYGLYYSTRHVNWSLHLRAADSTALHTMLDSWYSTRRTTGLAAGIGFGLMYLPSIAMVSFYFDKRRALATGLAVCGSGVGTFVFAPFFNFLVVEYGWKVSLAQ